MKTAILLLLVCFTASALVKTQSPRGALTFKAAAVVVANQQVSNFVVNASSLTCVKKIGYLPTSDLHAFVYQYDTYRVALWGKNRTLGTPAIIMPFLSSEPSCELLEDRIVVDTFNPYGSGPGVIREFDLANPMNMLAELNVGDANTRWGASCRTGNGSLVFINWIKTTNTPGQTAFNKFIVSYRIAPPSPYAGWTQVTLQFPTENGFAPIEFAMTAAEGSDGLVWVFFCCDSLAKIGLLKLKPEANTISVVDYQPSFVGPADPIFSPSPEDPLITAIADKINKRILLIYQHIGELYTDCPNWIASQVAITGVSTNGTKNRLFLTPWWSAHTEFPVMAALQRVEGTYFNTDYLNTTNCNKGYRSGMTNNSTMNPGEEIVAYSEDGWMMVCHPVSTLRSDYYLTAHRFKPTIKIGKSGNQISISWDQPSTADQLQKSSDLKTWADVAGATASPVLLSVEPAAKFFRVRQRL